MGITHSNGEQIKSMRGCFLLMELHQHMGLHQTNQQLELLLFPVYKQYHAI